MTTTIAWAMMEPRLAFDGEIDAAWNEADAVGQLTRLDDECCHDDVERDQELKPQPWEW